MKRISTVLIIVLAATSVYFLLRSDVFYISEIRVNGDSLPFVTVGEVQAEVAQYYKQSIFPLNTDQIANKISETWWGIADINVEKQFPNLLRVDYILRTPALVLQTKDKDFYVDEKGFVFAFGKNYELPVPKVKYLKEGDLLGEYIDEKMIEDLRKIQSYNWSRLELVINSIEYQADQYELIFENVRVLINANNEIAPQLKTMGLILEEAVKSGKRVLRVDLRFARPVVRYF